MPDPSLTAEDVIAEALALLDAAGLRGFTMRALADRLGTYPATVYWHVGNRTELLSAVGASVLGAMFADLPDPETTPWDEWLAVGARRYRRTMQRHPALATWTVTHFEGRIGAAQGLEQIARVLARAGFSGAELVAAYNAYVGTVVGWVGLELIPDDPDVGSDPPEMEAAVRALSADVAPTIVANLDEFANQAIAFRWTGGATNPLDTAFELTVRVLVDGLRRQLADG